MTVLSEPGPRVKELRIEKGLSQEALAQRAGISFSTVNKVENRRKSPTLATLDKLAEALGVDTKELLD